VDATEVFDSRYCRCGFIANFSSHYFTPQQTGTGDCAHSSLLPSAPFLDTHPSCALCYSQTRAGHRICRIQLYGIPGAALRGPRPGWRLNWALLTLLSGWSGGTQKKAWPGERIGKSSILAKGHEWLIVSGALSARCDYGTIAETSFE
jgi:hypothetical protein